MLLTDQATITTQRVKTKDGYMHVPAKLTRAGVMSYYPFEFADELPVELKSASKIRLLRPVDEVFNKDSLESFAFLPVTDGHPREFLTAKTVRRYQVGVSKGDVKAEGDYVSAGLVIQDADVIDKIEKGGVDQISVGSDVRVEWTAGTDAQYGLYDGIIRDIRGNHIALVPKGRAGESVKLADENKELKPMATRKVNGLSIELTDQAAEAFDALSAEIESMKSDNEKVKGEYDAKLADAAAELEKAKAEVEAVKLTDEQVEAKVEERIAVIDAARKLHKDLDAKGKSLNDIKVEALKASNEKLDLEDKAPEYVAAMFDYAVANHKPEESKKLAAALADGQTVKIEDSEAKREALIASSKDAWKAGLPA